VIVEKAAGSGNSLLLCLTERASGSGACQGVVTCKCRAELPAVGRLRAPKGCAMGELRRRSGEWRLAWRWARWPCARHGPPVRPGCEVPQPGRAGGGTGEGSSCTATHGETHAKLKKQRGAWRSWIWRYEDASDAAPSLQSHWDHVFSLIEILRFFGALDGPDGHRAPEWATVGPCVVITSLGWAWPDERPPRCLKPRAGRGVRGRSHRVNPAGSLRRLSLTGPGGRGPARSRRAARELLRPAGEGRGGGAACVERR